MSLIPDVINQFVYSLAIEGFDWNPEESLQLTFENQGSLIFEIVENDLLMYFIKEIDVFDKENILTRAMKFCHYKNNPLFDISAGLRGDSQLVFLLRLPERQVDLSTLTQALDALLKKHQLVLE